MRIRAQILCIAAALLLASGGAARAEENSDPSPAVDAAAPSVILIQNATILTVTHGTIEKGDILIKDGKISAVGGALKAPADALVIDASGQFVTPGIIDCH